MHDAGADIRTIQAILGHARLDTTQIYTQVSLKKLIDTHRRTHPAEQPSDSSTTPPASPQPASPTPVDPTSEKPYLDFDNSVAITCFDALQWKHGYFRSANTILPDSITTRPRAASWSLLRCNKLHWYPADQPITERPSKLPHSIGHFVQRSNWV